MVGSQQEQTKAILHVLDTTNSSLKLKIHHFKVVFINTKSSLFQIGQEK
jgi:hypothetical protein